MRGNDAPIARAYSRLLAKSARVPGGLVVLAGSGNPALAQRICDELGVPVGRATIAEFPDGELRISILEPMAGAEVIIVQSTPSAAQALIELLLIIDAARRSGAQRVTAVVPYLGYSRQDRRQGQEPLSSGLVAAMLETAGVDAVIALDLHSHAVEGCFRVPVVHLLPVQPFLAAWRQAGLDVTSLAIASPDPGGAKRAAAYCRALASGSDDNLVVLHKRRINGGAVEMLGMSGDVEGREVMIVDDLLSTGNTLAQAAAALTAYGACRVYASVTHLVLPESLPKLLNTTLAKLFICDSLPLPELPDDRVCLVDVAPLLAEAIDQWCWHS